MDLLTPLESMARQAGDAILAHRGKVQPIKKPDGTPVTQADLDADAAIQKGCADLLPEVPYLSEESDIPPFPERRDWKRFWLVDPLDGTKTFLRGGNDFTVNVALIENGIPTAGVLFAPARDLLYVAQEGQGSWKVEDGERKRIYSSQRGPDETLILVESYRHPADELSSYVDPARIGERIHAGSSIKFGYLAEGRADVYGRDRGIWEWDVAAGDCIYRNSGRSGPRISPFRYNKPDLKVSGFYLGLEK